MKTILALLAGWISSPLLWTGALWAQAVPDADRYDYGYHMMWGNGGWPMFFFGPLFMILVFAAIVAAIVMVLRATGTLPSAGQPSPTSRAFDILKERFAHGEIDKAEFEDRRKALGE
ncbi:MAG: SHOCT domain-containing protein [Pseudomonadota bacterium]